MWSSCGTASISAYSLRHASAGSQSFKNIAQSSAVSLMSGSLPFGTVVAWIFFSIRTNSVTHQSNLSGSFFRIFENERAFSSSNTEP